MELQERIEQALKEAIREQSENKRNAIRLLLTAVKMKEKELKRALTETEIQQVIASQIKQRRDSVEQYQAAKRADLAAVEEDEIRILQAFLPEAMSPEALEQLVKEAIAEVGRPVCQGHGEGDESAHAQGSRPCRREAGERTGPSKTPSVKVCEPVPGKF